MTTIATARHICLTCKVRHTVNVPEEGYVAWMNGMLIQRAMPQLSVDDREILISGQCPKAWDAIFPADEPESEEG